MLEKGFFVKQLAREHGLFLVFVRVERRDTLFGGAELFIGEALFLKTVELLVPRQQKRCAGADLELVGGELHALTADILDLFDDALGVDRHAVADDGHDALEKNTRREQVQSEFSEFVDDGVTGVAAALIAHDDVIVAADEVDHSAFALVAPVDAYNRTVHSYLQI